MLVDDLGMRTDPTPLQLLGEAGFLWSYLGQWQQAADVFNALVTLAPNDPCGYLGLAEIHLMQSQYPQAQKLAEQAAKAAVGRPNPNKGDRAAAARAYVIAGKALIHQHRGPDAKQTFLKAMELDPNGPSGRHAADMIEFGKKVGAA
jgi:tetratricopeptide (TPR) repeat protein